jgi:hypothetical protein
VQLSQIFYLQLELSFIKVSFKFSGGIEMVVLLTALVCFLIQSISMQPEELDAFLLAHQTGTDVS